MEAHLGDLGVWIAFIASGLGAILLAVDLLRRKQGHVPFTTFNGRNLIPLVVVGAVLATGAMQTALITHNFSIAYVAENNASVTPLIYSITGMWSALAGSILLWGLILTGYLVAVTVRYRKESNDEVIGWALAIIMMVATFFFGLMTGPANPFVTTGSVVPTSGAGPNSLLQNNPLVAIHPPLLYLGMVGFTVPFAFAIASLITGRVSDGLHIDTRRWALIAWTALTIGVVLGAWWSYQVLGWGGFWAWDPVENAALMPWLCATAFVHSIVVEERRGLLRVWNLSLAIGIFALTILATFFTRSGVVLSVHAFSDSSLGTILIGFFAIIVLSSLALIAWRGDALRSSTRIDAAYSREGAFVLNNILFVGFAAVVLVGTVFPMLYQALKGGTVTVGAPYFNSVAVPMGIGILFMMAVAPILSWRAATVKQTAQRMEFQVWFAVGVIVILVISGVRGLFALVGFFLATVALGTALRHLLVEARSERRKGGTGLRAVIGRSGGGMIVHVGVVIMAIGIVASTSYVARTEMVMRPGHVVSFHGHTFLYQGLRTVVTPVKTTTEALILVDGGGPFKPGVSQYAGRASEPVGTPAIDSGFSGDVYLTFDAIGARGGASGAQADQGLAPRSVAIGVIVEPLLPWLWAGGIIIGIGGFMAFVPLRRRRRRPEGERDLVHSESIAASV